MKLIVLIIEYFHPTCKSKLVDRVQQLKRALVHFPRQVAGMKEEIQSAIGRPKILPNKTSILRSTNYFFIFRVLPLSHTESMIHYFPSSDSALYIWKQPLELYQ